MYDRKQMIRKYNVVFILRENCYGHQRYSGVPPSDRSFFRGDLSGSLGIRALISLRALFLPSKEFSVEINFNIFI